MKDVIFKRVLKTMLRDKTIILVTHDLHLLSQVDKIVIFKEGSIVETGSYTELLANPNSEFNKLHVECEKPLLEIEDIDYDDSNNLPDNFAEEKDFVLVDGPNLQKIT